MDAIKFRQAERCRNGEDNQNDVTATTLVCRETGDHVHFPQRRRARSPRPHHAPSSPILSSTAAASASVRYSECRKNQAAGIGAMAYDGCGEFVAAGDDSMKCAACSCHRSFHRREPTAAAGGSIPIHSCGGSTTASAAAAAILKALELSSVDFRQIYRSASRYGGGGETKESPEDQKRIGKERSTCGGEGGGKESPENQVAKAEERPICGGEGKEPPENKDRKGKERRISGGDAAAKRFKTKFTAEQTERMREYAEKIRWRISNESGEEVDKFCAEIGVQRERFRIWLNNHKTK